MGNQNEQQTRILLADDSVLSRTVVKKQLGEMFGNVDISEAKNGSEAISMIIASRKSNQEFDLVLLDHMMPEKTGLDVLEFIRKTDKTQSVYILTANVQESVRNKAFELGCTNFINKTLNDDDLRAGLELEKCSD